MRRLTHVRCAIGLASLVAAVAGSLTGQIPSLEYAARRDTVAAGRSSIRVGHVDFFAAPMGTR